jgi:transcriptional regulator with XRE-family HTH domain
VSKARLGLPRVQLTRVRIRKAHGHARQADVAALMGVSQARVSQLESGDLSHTELGTLQSYVAALGGHLRIVADFGDDSVELTAEGA